MGELKELFVRLSGEQDGVLSSTDTGIVVAGERETEFFTAGFGGVLDPAGGAERVAAGDGSTSHGVDGRAGFGLFGGSDGGHGVLPLREEDQTDFAVNSRVHVVVLERRDRLVRGLVWESGRPSSP